MYGRISLEKSIIAWRQPKEMGAGVFVRELVKNETTRLDAYVGFEVLDVSADGELVALRGPWGILRNNNVAELVVLRWRTGERLFGASKKHLYFRALSLIPMQPRPIAETASPCFPSWRVSIAAVHCAGGAVRPVATALRLVRA